jgi:hypothetical protein
MAQLLFTGQRISGSQFAGVNHLEQLALYLKIQRGKTLLIQRLELERSGSDFRLRRPVFPSSHSRH